MGGCQNYSPLLGPLDIRCRIIIRTQDPKRDHNFEKHPYACNERSLWTECGCVQALGTCIWWQGLSHKGLDELDGGFLRSMSRLVEYL